MEHLFSFLAQISIIFISILPVVLIRKGRIRLLYVVFSFGLGGLDFFLTVFTPKFPFFSFPFFEHWNWSGKLASLLLMSIVLIVFPDIRKGSGLTFKIKEGAWKYYLPIILLPLFWNIYSNLGNLNALPTWATLLFQVTMPSVEELFFRGIALYLLTEALGSFSIRQGCHIPWSIFITSLWFGLIHSLYFNDGYLSFSPEIFLMTAIPAMSFVVLRWTSGTILVPILAHSLLNISGRLPALFSFLFQ